MSHRVAAADVDDDTSSQHSASTSVAAQKRTPNYAAPTTSQQLPEYANAEADQIKASFTTGNYRTIAHLPTELKAHHVSEATASRIDDNITSSYFVAPHGTYRKFGAKDALFSTFDYQPEEYSLASQIMSEQRQSQTDKQLKVHAQPFLYSTPRPQLINSLAGVATPAENAKYAGADVYTSAEEHSRRAAFLSAQKVLHGPFVPSTGHHSIGSDRVIRLKLPDIVARLMRCVDADWADTVFQIYADQDDLIIMQFEAETIDNPKGLLAYMNMFVKTNPVVSEYALAKLVDLWNHTAEGYIYYAFRPPFSRAAAVRLSRDLHIGPDESKGSAKEQKSTRAVEEASAPSSEQTHLPSGAATPAQPMAAAPPASSARSSQTRDHMASLMASFDAGLQGRHTPAANATSAAANAPTKQ